MSKTTNKGKKEPKKGKKEPKNVFMATMTCSNNCFIIPVKK